MTITPVTTRIFKENEDLFSFICDHVPKLKDGSILVVTSKIAALSEGRVFELDGNPDASRARGSESRLKRRERQRAKVIRGESEWAMPGKYAWLTMKDGILMANAGIDDSNARGKLILLPKRSFRTAGVLRQKLRTHYKCRDLGVLITDSHVTPNRAGIIGIALGYAGFCGIKDYRGRPDIFGRKMKITQLNIADCIASSAVLAMGEGRERQPLAIVENAPVQYVEKVNRKELRIDMKDDMYRPVFKKII